MAFRIAYLAVPKAEPHSCEHPLVPTRIRVACVAPQAPQGTAELRLQRGDGRTHPLAARIDDRERPGKTQQRDVERRIGERAQVTPVEVAPQLTLDRGND